MLEQELKETRKAILALTAAIVSHTEALNGFAAVPAQPKAEAPKPEAPKKAAPKKETPKPEEPKAEDAPASEEVIEGEVVKDLNYEIDVKPVAVALIDMDHGGGLEGRKAYLELMKGKYSKIATAKGEDRPNAKNIPVGMLPEFLEDLRGIAANINLDLDATLAAIQKGGQ